MPRYDFYCLSCGIDFEEQRRMAEASVAATCPSCRSTDTRKRFGGISVLKGGSSSISVAVNNGGGCGCGGGCACGH